MTTCKTGAEHIKSLKDGRTVYIDGELVPDVTEHPAFRNSVQIGGLALRFSGAPRKHRADDLHAATARTGAINRAWQMPRSYDEMVQRRKALQAWARAVLRLSWAARPITSRRRWSVSAWGSRFSASTARIGAKALAGYFEEASRNDYFLTYVIINPQAERGEGLGRAGGRPGRRASSTRTPAASRSAAPRCSAPARSWPTRCWSRTCSR